MRIAAVAVGIGRSVGTALAVAGRLVLRGIGRVAAEVAYGFREVEPSPGPQWCECVKCGYGWQARRRDDDGRPARCPRCRQPAAWVAEIGARRARDEARKLAGEAKRRTAEAAVKAADVSRRVADAVTARTMPAGSVW